MKRFKQAALLLLVTGISAQAASMQPITCERDRYFENEKIRCTLRPVALKSPATEIAHVTLSVLGKETQQQKVPLLYGGSSAVQFDPPAPLTAVIPLEIQVNLTRESNKESLGKQTLRLEIFPQDSLYWVEKDEFKGKNILVEKSARWVAHELEALGIPYLLDNNSDLQKLKRFDFRFNAANSQDLDAQDPWTRWELVQMLRKGIGQKSI